MKKLFTLSAITLMALSFGHLEANAARTRKLETKESKGTQVKERENLNTLRPDIRTQGEAAGQRTEVKQQDSARARKVEVKSEQSNALGPQCSLEQLAGRNTGDAARAGIITVGACATNFGDGEKTLNDEAKAVVADIGLDALAELRSLGTSLKKATPDQLASVSASMIMKFAQIRNISIDDAATRLVQVCSQCQTFAASLCSEATVSRASELLARRN